MCIKIFFANGIWLHCPAELYACANAYSFMKSSSYMRFDYEWDAWKSLEAARSSWTGSAAESGSALPLFASEKVQAINEVYHAIAVNGIVFRILAHCGADSTADVALVPQDIVELDAYRSGIAFQEILRDLGVPYQFVPIHAGVCISAAGVLRDVGRYRHVPRQAYVGACPV